MSNKGKSVKDRIEEMKKSREEGDYENPVFKKDTLVQESGKTIQEVPIDLLYDAPKEWNIYPAISTDKMIEMMFSIMENGLFNPIIVWKKESRYMILAGHNRVKAYKNIINEYKDTPNFNYSKYESIDAIVYEEDEIDELKAREIIIDSNYIQRRTDNRLTPIIVKERMDIVSHRVDAKGRTVKIVAEELGMSETKVYEDSLIATELIKEGQDLFFNNKINKKAALSLGRMPQDLQKWIVDEYEGLLTSKMLVKLKPELSKDDVQEMFDEMIVEPDTVRICVEVPEGLSSQFREMTEKWIKKNKKNM